MIREHQYRNDHQRGGPCTYKYYLTPCGRPQEDHAEVDYMTKADDQDMSAESIEEKMKRILTPSRRAFLLDVDLGSKQEKLHTAHLIGERVKEILEDSVSQHKPNVIFGADKVNPNNGKKRIRFIVLADLDPVPGSSFHTVDSAINVLQAIFQSRISLYNPIVQLAGRTDYLSFPKAR